MTSVRIFVIFLLWIYFVNGHETALCVELCPPCFQQEISECPSLHNCSNKVKEPGCGCCFICALDEGDRCGINRPPCGAGFKCLGRTEDSSLLAIIENRGTCQRVAANTNVRRERIRSTSRTSRRKSRKGRSRRRYPRHPHYGLLAPINHDGPCSRYYEDMMTSCHTFSHRVWLPTCDNRGFYAPKQCMSSTGLERGKCWCVNTHGEANEGTPYTTGQITCNR